MKIIFKYFLVCCLLFVVNSADLFAQNKIDSLTRLIEKAPEDSNKVNLYYELSRQFDVYKSKEAIEHSISALNLAKKINFTKGIQKHYNLVILNLFYKGVYDLAITYYHGYEKFLLENNLTDELLASYNLYANLLTRQKKYNEASKYYHICRQFQLSNENFPKYANVLNNIAILNMTLNQYDSALIYTYRAIDIFRKNNTASAYANSILLVSEILEKKDDFTNAEHRALESYDIYKIINEKHGMSNALLTLGEIYFKQGKIDSALNVTKRALVIADEIKIIRVQHQSFLQLSKIYNAQGNYKLAYDSHIQYKNLSDSIAQESLQGKMLEVEVKYDMTKKDLELERQSNLLDLQQKQKKYLIIGIVLIALMLATSMYAFVQKKKSNQIIVAQKKLVEEKQIEILDSIHYASKIQKALLAHQDLVNNNLPQNFILYNPKDIVSGDFYWATETKHNFYIAICDSTGHGVPGAFMSLLSITFLNEAINEKGIVLPNEVFNFVRNRIIEHIGKDGQRDGFDGVLFCINKNSKQITYSSANSKPVLMSNNTFQVLPSDRMPVGAGERKTEFSLFTINAQIGDVIYAYTDGYADQFGGPKGKKFMYKQLNEKLLSIHHLPILEQSTVLETTFKNWIGNLEQVDDVCLFGFKL